jgi:hypothetical protein
MRKYLFLCLIIVFFIFVKTNLYALETDDTLLKSGISDFDTTTILRYISLFSGNESDILLKTGIAHHRICYIYFALEDEKGIKKHCTLAADFLKKARNKLKIIRKLLPFWVFPTKNLQEPAVYQE